MNASTIGRYLNFRTLALMLFYGLISTAAYWLAYELRFDFAVPDDFALDRINTLPWVIGLQWMLLFAAGQLDSILSYFRLPDALRLFAGLFATTVILLSMWYVYSGQGVPPRSVTLSFFMMSFFSIAGFRVFMRIKSSRGLEDWLAGDASENVLIIGAGEVGAGLCSDLLNKSRLGLRPVAFLDDDPKKIGRFVHGIRVADEVSQVESVAKSYNASKVIIAFPSASVKQVKAVAELARKASLTVDTVPALTDLVSGRAELSQLRPIQLEDLLGRDPVDLDSDSIRAMLRGKRVLVTGAGGSIGQELVAQILKFSPSALICVDQAEIAIFDLQQNILNDADPSETEVTTLVLDLQNETPLETLFAHHAPQIVFHAAAHKHVSLMEAQPGEALRNNFLVTETLARITSQHGAERFILISTDKAINPTSVMGATKRMAELTLTAVQQLPDNTTQFMAVRFGNVLGSSGSVIPIFRRQIANGGPVTVTDAEVTRFFMTVEEAIGLVLQSATQGSGGEIFVLDMGDPVKIIDVAHQMIALSGLQEGVDIEIEFTGLLPGEKLFEEVQHLNESLEPTEHPRVMRLIAGRDHHFDLSLTRKETISLLGQRDPMALKHLIQRHVPEYTPWGAS